MSHKLNCILLIDDDEATNFIHKLVLRRMACAKEVVIKENGLKAIEYLELEQNGKFPQPDLILLDINMPIMNGWEFLEAYKKLNRNQVAKVLLVMLTTALNQEDDYRSNQVSAITDCIQKPLTTEIMENILKTHFK